MIKNVVTNQLLYTIDGLAPARLGSLVCLSILVVTQGSYFIISALYMFRMELSVVLFEIGLNYISIPSLSW